MATGILFCSLKTAFTASKWVFCAWRSMKKGNIAGPDNILPI